MSDKRRFCCCNGTYDDSDKARERACASVRDPWSLFLLIEYLIIILTIIDHRSLRNASIAARVWCDDVRARDRLEPNTAQIQRFRHFISAPPSDRRRVNTLPRGTRRFRKKRHQARQKPLLKADRHVVVCDALAVFGDRFALGPRRIPLQDRLFHGAGKWKQNDYSAAYSNLVDTE